jgi:hypothetical protein
MQEHYFVGQSDPTEYDINGNRLSLGKRIGMKVMRWAGPKIKDWFLKKLRKPQSGGRLKGRRSGKIPVRKPRAIKKK